MEKKQGHAKTPNESNLLAPHAGQAVKNMSKNSEQKICQNCKDQFIIEPEDFSFYAKIKVPPPTFCPECRAIRRLMWRNERTLYHNTCAFSGKKIISMFSLKTELVVYDRDIWWSDQWNPLDYGMDYDFSRPFFEQFKELLSKVPLANLGNTNIVNSDYGNHNADCRNCYLTYASFMNENVSYGEGVVEVKDSFDIYKLTKSEQCYEDVLCGNLYNTHFSYDSDDSIDSMFIVSCANLRHCLGCINLRHKSYYVFNKPYSKKEYEKLMSKYDFGSYKILCKFKTEYDTFIKGQFRRFAYVVKSVNVTGDNVLNAKNCQMIFDGFDSVENSKYVTHILRLRDSYDVYGGGGKAEFIYEAVDCGIDAAKNLFAILNHGNLETAYTYMCFNSRNLFGCIGLRKQDHCILNKKYTKEKYEKLLPKVIEHMNSTPYIDQQGRVYKYGEFFPMELSPFAYNETIAGEYYPLSQKKILDYGLKLIDKVKRDYEIEIKAVDLPDHIKDVDESIVGKVIQCLHKGDCKEQCTEVFKIRLQDLQFLKRKNFALPRLCPNCRHFERLKKRNPLRLWHRTCMCTKDNHPNHDGRCKTEFETSYAPERPEIIYCEKCYQAEVY